MLLSEEEDVTKYLKQVNMLTVARKTAAAWNDIPAISIRRSWQKLVPIKDDSGDAPGDSASSTDSNDLMAELQSLGHDVSAADVEACEEKDSPGYEHLHDDAIINLV